MWYIWSRQVEVLLLLAAWGVPGGISASLLCMKPDAQKGDCMCPTCGDLGRNWQMLSAITCAEVL